MLVVLRVVSPNEVELWEAIVTFLLFPALTVVAYSADRGWCGFTRQRGNKRQLELGPMQPQGQEAESEKMVQERNLLSDGKLDKDSLVAFVREVKKFPGLTNEDAALLAAAKYVGRGCMERGRGANIQYSDQTRLNSRLLPHRLRLFCLKHRHCSSVPLLVG